MDPDLTDAAAMPHNRELGHLAGHPAERPDGVIAIYRRQHPDDHTGLGLISKAFTVADEAHAGVTRRSGDPYITHPVAVAAIVADLGMDAPSIAAALLHDVVEDTSVTLTDVRSAFGSEITALVDGLTKLDGIKFPTSEAAQAATMRKMLIALAADLRVLVVKLADRLHNMRTIGALPAAKAVRIATETLAIYAPYAHRLGMHHLKTELEDRSFAVLHPGPHREITELVAERSGEQAAELEVILGELRAALEAEGIDAVLSGRTKSTWSIYRKMETGKRFEDIFDVVGARVVVDTIPTCYAALGTIHATYAPVPGRVKDYIAQPRFNLYRSLHTTVVGPHGRPVEVQVRTAEMHRVAELGVAAHWTYKGGWGTRPAADLPWVDRLLETSEAGLEPGDYLDALRAELDTGEVFVFTPAGDVLALTAGSTPVDFAYAVHTAIGHRCTGARINGRLSGLDTPLRSGDRVEIIVSPDINKGPSRDWLRFATTPRARTRIRRWLANQRRADAVATGRAAIAAAFADLGMTEPAGRRADTLVRSFGLTSMDGLAVAVAEGHISAGAVAQRHEPRRRKNPGGRTRRRLKAAAAADVIYVDGRPDVTAVVAVCCKPQPGDHILGFVTRSRGVTVHHVGCTNAAWLSSQTERIVPVAWEPPPSPGGVTLAVHVEALNRNRLLADVTAALADCGIDIVSAVAETSDRSRARIRLTVTAGSVDSASDIVASVTAVRHVFSVDVGDAT